MTTGKRILILDEALLQTVDELRGELSRSEFITLCVETALQDLYSAKEESDQDYALPRGVSHRRGHENGAVRTYPGGSWEKEEATAKGERTLWPRAQGGGGRGRNGHEEGMAFPLTLPLDLNQWWLLAILLFGFGDTLTSLMVFARGGVEANPLMGFLLPLVGNNIWGFVLIKTVAVVALLYISYKQVKSKAWIIPALASAAGAYLVLNNLVHFLKMS